MACVLKYIYPNTGTVVWRIQFQRTTEGIRETFAASFKTEEEAWKFCDKWEHIFFLKGKDAIEIDRLHERRRRKFHDKIEYKT